MVGTLFVIATRVECVFYFPILKLQHTINMSYLLSKLYLIRELNHLSGLESKF